MAKEICSAVIESPVGDLVAIRDGAALCQLRFAERADVGDLPPRDDAAFDDVREQLTAYFDRRRTRFDLELAPTGTEFQLSVWSELERIPYGEAISYGELARRIGNPKAVRAVGGANNKNPITIIIPCHRVIGASKTLVGYGGGLERKTILLELEGIVTAENAQPQLPF